MFTGLITKHWGSCMDTATKHDRVSYEDDDDINTPFLYSEDIADANQHLLDQQPTNKKLINFKIFAENGAPASGVVCCCATASGSHVLVSYKNNNYFNPLLYEIEFENRAVSDYSTNLITKNLLAQTDEDGLFKC